MKKKLKDWNEIIEKFHLISTKIWYENLETTSTVLITNSFNDSVLRNAPKEANRLLGKLQDLILKNQ